MNKVERQHTDKDKGLLQAIKIIKERETETKRWLDYLASKRNEPWSEGTKGYDDRHELMLNGRLLELEHLQGQLKLCLEWKGRSNEQTK